MEKYISGIHPTGQKRGFRNKEIYNSAAIKTE